MIGALNGLRADSSRPTVVEANDLVKSYDGITVVHGVTIAIAQGESLGIVGESGSGKSTVAKMLVGLTRADSGTITILGEDRSKPAHRLKDRRRRGQQMQMVFQNPYESLDRSQTVGSALREVLDIHDTGAGRAARENRVNELMEMVGVPKTYLDARPGRMSGGLRQRVAIARAMAARPACIILDEAVSALDVSIQAQIVNLLNDLRANTGVSYLFISHDLAVVRELTSKVVVMRRGEVVEGGDTAAVLQDPQHPYTQRLRASVPVPGWVPQRAVRAG
jgi:oligopeptide transport system ATP-binding protein